MTRLLTHGGGRVGLALVAFVLIFALFAPLLATHDPEDLDVLNRFAGPSAAHWLGTDQVGRDLYSRLVYGTRVAIGVAVSVIAIALITGVALGVIAAFAGGWVERALLVLFDIVAAFPSLILALAVVAVFGPSTRNVILIVASTLVPQFGRIARAQVLVVKTAPFLDAERILGASAPRIVLRHVLPNILGPLIVLASMDIPVVITLEAGLSFIGLGVRPPLASWGTLINDGYSYLSDSIWPVLSASVALAIATLGFTLLGEALRDAVDPPPAAPRMTPLATITGLTVRAPTPRGPATILRGVSLTVGRGRIVGVVGESGSGKSTLAGAIMRMLPPGLAATGRIDLDGTDLLALPEPAMARLRGTRLAMIFQDPMTALNPLFTVGTQMADVLRRRRPGLSRRAAAADTAAMLARVGLSDAPARLHSYPHELSGGMRQRVVIAMALLVQPDLLIADEPTTALDATVEAQIAALFTGLRADFAGSILFISHHLGLVSQLCDDVCVMYGGTVVETGPVDAVVTAPKHPYTRALLTCEITADGTGRLVSIPGEVPDPVAPMTGCIFAARCPDTIPACRDMVPALACKAPSQYAACIRVPDA